MAHRLEEKLQSLRTRLRISLAVAGIGRLLMITLTYFAMTFLLDWLFHLTGATRLFMLLVGVACIGFTFVRHLVQPLALPLNQDNLALLIERHFPELKESLISAVQFKRGGTASSEPLIRRVLEEVDKNASHIDFARIISIKKPVEFFALGSLLLLVCAFQTFSNPHLVRIWASRMVNPYSAVQWPRSTQLSLGLQKVTKIARGEDLHFEISVNRGQPSKVIVEYENEQGTIGIRRINKNSGNQFKAFFPRLSEPMKIRAKGGDDITDWHSIEVLERPRVTRINVEVEYPEYTGQKKEVLQEGQGNVHAVAGTKLKIKAYTDIPVYRAILAVENGNPTQMEITDSQNLQGEVTLRPEFLSYRVEVQTQDEIANSNPLTFKLSIIPDNPPLIKLQDLESEQEYTANGELPLQYSAKDDFGIQSVSLKWQIPAAAGTAEEDRGGESILLDQIEKKKVIQSEYTWKLETLKLHEGGKATFHLEASDYDEVQGPNIGKTREYTIHIVSSAKLEATLVQRESAARRELEHLRKQQQLTRRRVEDIYETLNQNGELDTKSQEQHVKAELEQRQITRDASALKDNLRSMLSYIKNNKLTGFEREDQIEAMKFGLEQLTSNQMPKAGEALQQSRANSRDAKPEIKQLNEAITLQKDTERKLEEMLATENEGGELDKLIQRARNLTNRQQRLNQKTKESALKLLGRSKESLDEEEKTEIESLIRDQAKVAETYKDLEQRIGNLIDTTEKDNPELSGQLLSVLSEARQSQIRTEMSSAEMALSENKLLSALKPQENVDKTLQRLLERLRRSKSLEDKGLESFKNDLSTKFKEMMQLSENQQFLSEMQKQAQEPKEQIKKSRRQLDQLKKEQEELNTKTKEGQKLPQDQQPDAMQKLAEEQSQTKDNTEQQSQNLQQMAENARKKGQTFSAPIEKAAERTAEASQQMAEAEKDLKKSTPKEASQKQENAEQALVDAEKLMEEAEKDADKTASDQNPQLQEKQKDYAEQSTKMAGEIQKTSEGQQSRRLQTKQNLEDAANQMQKASEAMNLSQEAMKENKQAEAGENQKKAMESLQKSMQKIADVLRQISATERQKKLDRIRKDLTELVRFQKDINDVIAEAYQKKLRDELDRALIMRIGQLNEAQDEQVKRGEDLLLHISDDTVPLFAWSLKEVIKVMGLLGTRLGQRQIGLVTQRMASSVYSELQALLGLVHEQEQKEQQEQGQSQPQEQADQSPPKDLPLIPPLVQLKMLKRMEFELYRETRTIEIEKVLNPGTPLPPFLEKRMTEMADRQSELAKITETLGKLMQQQYESSGNQK